MFKWIDLKVDMGRDLLLNLQVHSKEAVTEGATGQVCELQLVLREFC